jgi:uncharacterized membrane protein
MLVFRRSRADQVKDLAVVAQPYAKQIVADEKVRAHALAALASSLRARNRLLASMGITGLGWRLATNEALQAELRRIATEVSELGKRGERVRKFRRRRQRLIAGGFVLAGLAAAAAAGRALRGSSRVEQSIDVEVPVTTAYNQWTQFEEFSTFMEGVDRVEQLDDTHLHWIVSFGGRRHEFDAEIIEQRPDSQIAWRTTAGKQHDGNVTFHRLGDERSRVAVQMEWKPEGLYEQIGGLVGVAERRVKGDLRRFKELIESRGSESGGWRGEVDQTEVVTR